MDSVIWSCRRDTLDFALSDAQPESFKSGSALPLRASSVSILRLHVWDATLLRMSDLGCLLLPRGSCFHFFSLSPFSTVFKKHFSIPQYLTLCVFKSKSKRSNTKGIDSVVLRQAAKQLSFLERPISGKSWASREFMGVVFV